MKPDLEQMHEKFMSLSANRADELAKIYGGPGAENLDRAAQWRSMLEDAPANRTYMMNALGMGHDAALVEVPEPSADDKAAARALANPTATTAELEAEAKAPKAGTFGHRTQEELAEIMYGRGRY